MDFTDAELRLVGRLRAKVQSGELTERRIASMTGISQPHIHNVLKGQRALSTHSADVLLRYLELDILDLIEPGELLAWSRRR